MKYSDIDKRKTAFIFELDDVIYPEKDYLFQVYYLFASLIEYTELFDAKVLTDLMVSTHVNEGKEFVFDRIKEKFAIDEKYRVNFYNLILTAKLPLKLLVYQAVLDLMQEIVVDRKRLFIVTNGNPAVQLNKMKQTEWHGLQQYLTCYFAQETLPKPEPDTVVRLMKEHDLQQKDMLMIGNNDTDMLCAEACGIDYIKVEEFIRIDFK